MPLLNLLPLLLLVLQHLTRWFVHTTHICKKEEEERCIVCTHPNSAGMHRGSTNKVPWIWFCNSISWKLTRIWGPWEALHRYLQSNRKKQHQSCTLYAMSIICKQMYFLCTQRDCSSFPGFDNQKTNKMMLPMSWREKKRKDHPKPLNPWCKQEWQPRTQNKNSSDGYGRKQQQQQWKNQNLTHLVHMLQFSLVTACRWRTSSLALKSFPSPPSPPPLPPASGWVLHEIKLHTSSLSTNIPKQKEKEFEGDEGDDGVGCLFVCCCCCCCKTLNPKPSKNRYPLKDQT